MSLAEFALGLAGVPQQTIADIEKSAPAAAALLKLFKDNQVLVSKIEALAIEAAPLITQAMPLIQQAQAELKVLIPTAQEVIAFIQSQQQKPTTDPLYKPL